MNISSKYLLIFLTEEFSNHFSFFFHLSLWHTLNIQLRDTDSSLFSAVQIEFWEQKILFFLSFRLIFCHWICGSAYFSGSGSRRSKCCGFNGIWFKINKHIWPWPWFKTHCHWSTFPGKEIPLWFKYWDRLCT